MQIQDFDRKEMNTGTFSVLEYTIIKKRSALNAFIILSYNVLHLYICCAHGLTKPINDLQKLFVGFFYANSSPNQMILKITNPWLSIHNKL